MSLAPAKRRAVDPAQSPGQWLAAIMRAHQVDQVQLEAISDIDQTTISRVLKSGRASDRVMKRLAATLKVPLPPEVLAQTVRGRRARGAPEPEISAARGSSLTGAKPTRPGFDVPVWHAFLIRHGPLFLLQTAPSEFAWRPPCLSSARRAFMLRMPGASMDPWRTEAEPIFFDPDADIATARHALLQFDIGEPQDTCVICRLLSPPKIGEAANARVYVAARRSPIPQAPVRKIIPAVEWAAIIPT